jgi:hypothetical protein
MMPGILKIKCDRFIYRKRCEYFPGLALVSGISIDCSSSRSQDVARGRGWGYQNQHVSHGLEAIPGPGELPQQKIVTILSDNRA